MRARYIQEVGTLGRLRIYWDGVLVESVDPCDQCPGGHPRFKYADSCPNAMGLGGTGVHNAYAVIGKSGKLRDWESFGKVEDYPEERWPTSCHYCGAAAPAPPPGPEPRTAGASGISYHRQVIADRMYGTASGLPEPGDVYEMRWHEPGKCAFWDNCSGVHWWGVLPNGRVWDIDSRCSNCTLRDERTHRCWIRSGSAEAGTMSVGKAGGHTCSAGGGSILVPGWHGFLTDFEWRGG